jgi:hypothetical protein
MGFFSFDKSNYEALRNICDKTEKASIEYDKLDMETAGQVKAGKKFIAKARAAMDRGTLSGTKTLDYIRQLVDLYAHYASSVKLLTESPEESERRINEMRAEEDAELHRNEEAAKGDIWDSLDK